MQGVEEDGNNRFTFRVDIDESSILHRQPSHKWPHTHHVLRVRLSDDVHFGAVVLHVRDTVREAMFNNLWTSYPHQTIYAGLLPTLVLHSVDDDVIAGLPMSWLEDGRIEAGGVADVFDMVACHIVDLCRDQLKCFRSLHCRVV